MTAEWIRFWITAACLAAGLSGFGCAVLGVYRFGFVMNRMHAAGIGDTFGLFFTTLGLALSSAEARVVPVRDWTMLSVFHGL